jgi:4-amino-4-deoxy-L-arabinose transferase-like glycosyltransferase
MVRDADSRTSSSTKTRPANVARSEPVRVALLGLWPYGLILVLGIVVLLPGLGDLGFWDPREPKYVQGAREMIERGSFFLPTYRGEALAAAPLPFWSIAVGSLLLGLGEIGARAGGICVALVALLAVYYAVSRLRGRRPALLAAVVLATMPQFYLLARQATPDVFVVAGLGVGLLFFGLGLYTPDRRRNLHFALSGGGVGVAALAKGPGTALGIFLSVLLVYAVIRFDGARLKKMLRSAVERRRVAGHVLFFGAVLLLTLGPWIGSVALGEGGATAGATVLLGGEEQQKPFYYYFRPLIFGCFPWIVFLPLAVMTLVRWRVRDPFDQFGFEGFLLVAAAVTFTFVSIPAGKWPSYAAPLLVPLAVLVGLVLDRLLRTTDGAAHRFSWTLVLVLYMPATMDLLRGDGIEYLLESTTSNGEVPEVLLPGPLLTVLLFAIGATLAASILVRSRVLIGVLALATTCFAVYHGGVFVPSLDPAKSMKGVCDVWSRHRSAGQRVGFYGEEEGSTYFYCDAKVEMLHGSTFLDFMNPETPAFCIVDRKKAKELIGLFQAEFTESSLHVVDDRHQTHTLIANHVPGAS